MKHWRCGALAAGATAAALMGTPAAADSDAARGETIAVEACSSCHQVKASQAIPPPVADPDSATQIPAPSFLDIAASRGNDPDHLRRVILAPPHPMREQQWSETDLKAVVAYIRSLRKPAAN